MSGVDDLGRTKQRVAWASLVLWSLLPWIVACGGSSPAQPANRAPAATIGVTPAGQALVDVTILTFTAQASDPDGDPLDYSWSFGDGAVAAGPFVNHVYATAGEFLVQALAPPASPNRVSTTMPSQEGGRRDQRWRS